MRRFVQFLLLGGLLAIPAVAQRGGDGFHGRVLSTLDITGTGTRHQLRRHLRKSLTIADPV